MNIRELDVKGCQIWSLPCFKDSRGDLMVIEFAENLPFKVERCFFVSKVTNDKIRGEHAHKECHQFLIALAGTISVTLDNGVNRQKIILDDSKHGLYMPINIWGEQSEFTENAILGVFASHKYNEDSYIRNYEDYKKYIEKLTISKMNEK